ncbi:MAG: lamin tail domain-containing protein [Bacteroidales bacterium]
MKKAFYKLFFTILFVFCSTSSIFSQSYFDFETGNLPSVFVFSKSNHRWRISPNALAENFSLQDSVPAKLADTSTFSFLVKPSINISVDTFSCLLNFIYGTGSTATTSTNRFAIFVGSNVSADSLLLANRKVQSFVIGINGSSNDDTLRLFYLNNGVLTRIISTEQRVNGRKLSILLQRHLDNTFTLSVGEGTNFQNLQHYNSETVPYEFGGNHIGMQMFTSTASNKKILALDNIKANFALKNLEINSIKRIAVNKIHIEFNKILNLQELLRPEKYTWENVFGEIIHPISVDVENAKSVILTFAEDINTGNYILQMLQFTDEFGNVETAQIQTPIKAYTYGDIVFSELMIKPNTESEFSEEYIELYNRTAEDIELSNWKIETPSRQGRITTGVIKAKEYALIGNPACEQGKIDASPRPTLLDAGTTLMLKDDCDVPIAEVTYNDNWYADEEKKIQGGWSIEKKDLNNLQEISTLWRASMDEKGGTPCAKNSVTKNMEDTEPPICIGFSITKQQVELEFNEALKIENLMAENFELEGYGTAEKVYFTRAKPSRVQLTFSHTIEQHKTYRLIAHNSICDLAGQCIELFEIEIGFGESPSNGDIIINELLFNPYTGGVDFVELYNRSNKIIETQNLKIANRRNSTGNIDKIYTLPNYTLLPNTYVVLTTNPYIIQTQYYCKYPQAFITLSNLPTYANDQGCVVLLNEDSTQLEEFYYTEKMHSNILSNKKGISLERINPHRPASEASNWLSAAQLFGFATPTYKNSQYSENEGDTESTISISPEVFSPDGDGVDDVLFINYNLPEAGYIANVKIFTAKGRLVKTLLQNVTLATEGRFSWDGVGDNAHIVPIGIYIVQIELFTLNGKVQRYKKPCVVGARL